MRGRLTVQEVRAVSDGSGEFVEEDRVERVGASIVVLHPADSGNTLFVVLLEISLVENEVRMVGVGNSQELGRRERLFPNTCSSFCQYLAWLYRRGAITH